MKIKILFILLSLATSSSAALLKHETNKSVSHDFSFREVCEKLGAKNFELIEAKSISEIDCMGKVFPAMKFCLSKFPQEQTLTRAIVDEKSKLVKCEMSESVMVSISCDQRDLKYCLDPKKGCEELRQLYAQQLEVVHFSMLDKKINCYFAKKAGESLDEIN